MLEDFLLLLLLELFELLLLPPLGLLEPPDPFTITVPCMIVGWNVHVYLYVPPFVKRKLPLSPFFKLPVSKTPSSETAL